MTCFLECDGASQPRTGLRGNFSRCYSCPELPIGRQNSTLLADTDLVLGRLLPSHALSVSQPGERAHVKLLDTAEQ